MRRVEKRRCTQLAVNRGRLTEGSDWKALQTMIRIKSERHLKAKTTKETRYYISPLPVDAEQTLKTIRSHWEVENKLHWVLGVTFCEDASRVRSDNGAEMLNVLRKIALSIARLYS